MLTAIDALQRFTLEEAQTDQMALESYIRLGTFIGDGMVATGDYDKAEKQFQEFYQLSCDMQSSVLRQAEWYPRHFELFEIIIRSYTTSGEYERVLPWVKRCEDTAEAYYNSAEFKTCHISQPSMLKAIWLACKSVRRLPWRTWVAQKRQPRPIATT